MPANNPWGARKASARLAVRQTQLSWDEQRSSSRPASSRNWVHIRRKNDPSSKSRASLTTEGMASRTLGAVGVAAGGPRLDRSKGIMGLPLSVWHVGLAWFDVITDIMGIVSTKQLANNTDTLCGLNLQGYFYICFLVQCALLSGNVLTHVVLAVVHELHFTPGSPIPGDDEPSQKLGTRAYWVILAVLRALFQCELAYHEFKRRNGASPGHTAGPSWRYSRSLGSLHYEMAELVWEAPQVVISWLCLVVSFTYAQMAVIQGLTLNSKDFWVPVQLLTLNALVGLFSLAITAQEFIRMHPRSAWASSLQPSKLLLGLIDFGWSWLLGVICFVHAFVSLFNRSMFYMLIIHNFGAWSIILGEGQSPLWRVPILLPIAGIILNLVCLAGLGVLAMVPAAVLSMFVSIPWASGRTVEERISKWSSLPSLVLELIQGCGMIAVFVWIGKLGRTPDSLAAEICQVGHVQPLVDDYLQLTMVVPVCTTGFEMVLFFAVTVWQFAKRHSYIELHGDRDPLQMARALHVAYRWPDNSVYRWKGVFAYLVTDDCSDAALPTVAKATGAVKASKTARVDSFGQTASDAKFGPTVSNGLSVPMVPTAMKAVEEYPVINNL